MTESAPLAIPSAEQCRRYFDDFAMFDNIRLHSILVARVAAALVDGLASGGKCPGPVPSREFTVAAALLHDIAKTPCIAEGCHHAEVGRDICNQLGYPEIGEIVAEHVRLREIHTDLYRDGLFTAKELVYYADKRVRHDRIVPLSGRLDYILQRYGDNDPTKEALIRANFARTLQFEELLFARLPFTPQGVEKASRTAIFAEELTR